MKRFVLALSLALFSALGMAVATDPAAVTLDMQVPIAAPTAAHPASVPAGSWFTSGRNLYKPDGKLFYPAGVNNNHWDQAPAAVGIPLTGANSVRLSVVFTQSQAVNWKVVDPYVAAGLFPIIANLSTTCKTDTASLQSNVDNWIAQLATWTKYNGVGAINIANEWGPLGLTTTGSGRTAVTVPNYTWRDNYITAVSRMRSAGYNGLLVIDAPYCGQDAETIVRDGPAVLAADPQHNLLFDIHIYGTFHYPATSASQGDYKARMTAMSASGLPILVGEFGPAPYTTDDGVVHTIGASATLVPTLRLLADIKQAGLAGWLVWGYNDNNLAGCKTVDVGWFGMTNYCSTYTGLDSQLTAFGRLMVPILKATNGK
jgi:mannan endo-1,4-beta-mannosidase